MHTHTNRKYRKKQFLIEPLLNLYYLKTPDGRQLYELSCAELQNTYVQEMHKVQLKYNDLNSDH